MKNKIIMPQIVQEAWENRQKAIVFTTVNTNGVPNSIYATCVARSGDNKILVANNFFCKTIENIKSGSTGSILFITNEDKSFQLKGSLSYYEEGELFDDMKSWNPTRLPGHGVVALEIEEVFAGAEKIS